ncbi:hypothetical protein L6452_20965 [Arctium lappa]|uniref:Uncharacterized protein n=1 Tax=Arctium lappa TaxID=4217 RepID=A0ACB9BDC7_ARCLA|nr:hypothetical protein L6452_20965 [Arctium lappa]
MEGEGKRSTGARGRTYLVGILCHEDGRGGKRSTGVTNEKNVVAGAEEMEVGGHWWEGRRSELVTSERRGKESYESYGQGLLVLEQCESNQKGAKNQVLQSWEYYDAYASRNWEIGKVVLGLAAKSNLKPVSLELGGKFPFIVCEDANVDEVVDLTHLALFYNQLPNEHQQLEIDKHQIRVNTIVCGLPLVDEFPISVGKDSWIVHKV